MTARMTEASRTTLLTIGSLAPLSDQLIDQRDAWLHVLPSATLRSCDAKLHGRDPQFIILKAQYDFVPRIDPEGLPKRRGDHDAATFIGSEERRVGEEGRS